METNILRLTRTKSVWVIGASLGIIGLTTSAKGVVILPNQTLAPTGDSVTWTSPPIADTSPETFTGTDAESDTVFTGSFDSQVYRDSLTGDLDFVYSISNNDSSLDSIERMTASQFAGYSTDADYIAGTGSSSPFLVTRSATGDTLGFTFLPSSGIAPGTTADLLVIKTDALGYALGTVSVSDGGTANISAYVPVTVPEPATVSLLALSLGGLVLRPRKKP